MNQYNGKGRSLDIYRCPLSGLYIYHSVEQGHVKCLPDERKGNSCIPCGEYIARN